jgi:outer membrane protein assembly factor BamB
MRVCCPTLLLLAVALCAADWPQYRGPNADGISPERGLARTWPAEGPPVLWTRDLSRGYAGAAVHGGEVFVLDSPNPTQDVLRCLDLTTGKENWTYAYPTQNPRSYPGARTVPTVDATNVFIMSASGQLQCLNRKTRQQVWSHNIINEFERHKQTGDAPRGVPQWGITQHPLLYRDTVIAAPHAVKVGVVAYDTLTGDVRWQSPPIGRHCFNHVSPTLCRLLGVDQVVMVANTHCGAKPTAIITGTDANTGTQLWSYVTTTRYNVPIPSPVQVGTDCLFISGGYTIGSFGLWVTGKKGEYNAHATFERNMNCTTHIQTPVVYQGHIYANSFDQFHNKENNGLVCLDFDGNLRWKTGPGRTFDSGNLIIGDGLIFILNGATGELSLVRANPDRYELLARAQVLKAEGGEAWAPMALADGKLIVRDLRQMKCLDVRNRLKDGD